MRRRTFVGSVFGGSLWASNWLTGRAIAVQTQSQIKPLLENRAGEDIFQYIARYCGRFDLGMYLRILGSANEFKEGDSIVGVSAANEPSRVIARTLLSNTLIADIDAHPPHLDELHRFITVATNAAKVPTQTVGDLKEFLLRRDEAEVHALKNQLSSDVIACVVKLLSNEELITVGAKIFNPLPNSQIGAKGYLGARIQPNSPTDNLDDIRWQVFNGFAYAVGDVLLGTNPVSSDPDSVEAIERTLQDILRTFEIDRAMPHCVLAHIDVQAQVEHQHPGSTELWFQSIAGSDTANVTFDISVEKMRQHARARASGDYGLYFETGQGADFTNGHGHGMDMLIHESRKYGFARALMETIREARVQAGLTPDAWVHVNDVAGFIGPEVFRSKEQLVRCCLEDIVMGKLHGLTIGLDVCSTLHMDVSLDDLDWCLDQVAPANPAYLMALPTKIDPMLGYLTTGFQDHVRLRNKFGYRVNDRMWKFFQSLQIIDGDGNPTQHFGNPTWVYLQYQRRKGDLRPDEAILADGRERIQEIRSRGVFIAEGHGREPWNLNEKLNNEIQSIYQDAKKCIWREWEETFVDTLPQVVRLESRSSNREDYILHPTTGEHLSDQSRDAVLSIRHSAPLVFDCAIVVSEGLNALAAMDEGQLLPLVSGLQNGLQQAGYRPAPQLLVVTSGRVRAGYRIGELLFHGINGRRTIIHIIGERPGSGHHTLSVYMTTANGADWSIPDKVDHNITRVVSGIATTALHPNLAVKECLKILTS
jgi:ethanolamine ammonia-lyase large subunit